MSTSNAMTYPFNQILLLKPFSHFYTNFNRSISKTVTSLFSIHLLLISTTLLITCTLNNFHISKWIRTIFFLINVTSKYHYNFTYTTKKWSVNHYRKKKYRAVSPFSQNFKFKTQFFSFKINQCISDITTLSVFFSIFQ